MVETYCMNTTIHHQAASDCEIIRVTVLVEVSYLPFTMTANSHF